jgi:predicted secreted protein
MDIVSGIAIYLVIWWVALFCVLPWGFTCQENPEPGHAASAPANPRLGLKFLVTSGISAIIWLVIYVSMKSGIADFRSLAAAMMQKDEIR